MQRDQIIGLWKLLSFEMKNSQAQISFPFGKKPLGYIVYLDNGFMSAHLSRNDRNTVNAAVLEDALPVEKIQMLESYFSYCGRYELIGNFVHHYVELCTFPNQLGMVLVRRILLNGCTLELSSEIETPSGKQSGKQFFTALWEKVS